MRSLGKIMTGLLERSGTSSAPELHSAAQALCSSEHIAAVNEGLVSVGVATAGLDVAITRLDLNNMFAGLLLPIYCGYRDGELAKMPALSSRQRLTPRRDCDITSNRRRLFAASLTLTVGLIAPVLCELLQCARRLSMVALSHLNIEYTLQPEPFRWARLCCHEGSHDWRITIAIVGHSHAIQSDSRH